MQFTRSQILERLRAQTAEGKAILGAGVSNGLIARCAAAGGADLLIVYSTGKTRMMGVPTTMITGVSNPITLQMIEEMTNVVHDTPFIGGVEADDIYMLDLEASLERFPAKGFSGVINFPTVGLRENLLGDPKMTERKFNASFAAGYGQDSWGWQREVDMIRMAREKDLFTMTYVVTRPDAEDMARAGADVICVHVGPSKGGRTGYTMTGHDDTNLDGLMAYSQDVMDGARAANPDVICLLHGGPFYDPESTRVIYEKTDAEGFVAASAVERIPIERAVVGVCEEFKKQGIRG